jgi:hypothetical protein
MLKASFIAPPTGTCTRWNGQWHVSIRCSEFYLLLHIWLICEEMQLHVSVVAVVINRPLRVTVERLEIRFNILEAQV